MIQKDCSACISYIESISQSHVGRLFGNFGSQDIHLIRNESPLKIKRLPVHYALLNRLWSYHYNDIQPAAIKRLLNDSATSKYVRGYC